MAKRIKQSLLFAPNGTKYLWPFILITSLFFFWGLANSMTDTLLAAFKRIMSMTDFQTSLIQIAFFGAYFCFAIPAAIFIKKFTYKSGILMGLLLYTAGCFLFYPAGNTASYSHYLIAIYILAGGCAILETSANPYILVMGSEESATRRLNLAQSFNPIGAMAGILLSQHFILSELHSAGASDRAAMDSMALEQLQRHELNAVTMTYIFVGLVLLVVFFLILFTKMPNGRDHSEPSSQSNVVSRLLRNKRYILGVVAQFFYVGAQIGVWSYTIRYVMVNLGLNEAKAASYYLASILLFAVARFIFTGLMKFFTPGRLLVVAAVGTMLATAVVVMSGGYIGVIALVIVSGFMSLMFPTIYGLSMGKLGADTKIAGSGHIMAILGGAVLTAIQGLVSDVTGSINKAFIVPLLCYIVVAIYGYWVSVRIKA